MRTADQIVAQEVIVCVSSLVSTIAGGYGDVTSDAMADVTNQAFELACPIPDYEEAAREDGGVEEDGCWVDRDGMFYADAAEYCNERNIEPYDREVFEHWAITSWLADKLEAKGEKVDRDFAGLIVWARTTTGQAIAADHVFEQIAAELA